MNLDELKNKIVCLYPMNHMAKLLWDCKEQLEFDLLYVFQSEQDRTEASIVAMLERAEILMIMEDSPLTSLMPPLSVEAEFYQLLLSVAQNLNIRIVSYELEKAEVINSEEKEIVIEPLQSDGFPYDKEWIKKNPIIMVMGVHRQMGLHRLIEKLQNCLSEKNFKCFSYSNKLYSKMFRENKTAEPELMQENRKQDEFIVMEGLFENYFLMTKDSISKEEQTCFGLMLQLKPDITFLYIDERDSYEMVKETITLYESKGFYIAGAILKEDSNYWYRAYMEGKIGIPVLSESEEEFSYQFLSLVLNCFRVSNE